MKRREPTRGYAEGGGVTLQAIEAELCRDPELNKLSPTVVEALARAVMRFVQGQATFHE